MNYYIVWFAKSNSPFQGGNRWFLNRFTTEKAMNKRTEFLTQRNVEWHYIMISLKGIK